MTRRLSFLLVMIFVTGLLVPFGASAQDDANVLRFPISPDPEHLNPFTATTIAISTILNSVYEGLFQLDSETGQPAPALAESYEVSDDGLVYTFQLRKGVLFHEIEGVTFTDDDREFKAD